jgi:predicted unusual protein kinase regulating ubiquinone biosynthesis (AarF/ABC1/UbiB family)
MLLSGLEKEGVAKVKNVKGLYAYFASVDQKPLAAASIGQVHTALTYSGERVVVKAIYPEIRRYLIADLKNARKAAQQISWVLKLPMKGTIDAIMDEEVECFPRSVTQRTLKLLQLE